MTITSALELKTACGMAVRVTAAMALVLAVSVGCNEQTPVSIDTAPGTECESAPDCETLGLEHVNCPGLWKCQRGWCLWACDTTDVIETDNVNHDTTGNDVVADGVEPGDANVTDVVAPDGGEDVSMPDSLPDGQECVPMTTDCSDDMTLRTCRMDGTGYLYVNCPEQRVGDVCRNGQCVPGCAVAGGKSNQGCQFVAIDMEQFIDTEPPYYGENAPFAIVVSNTDDKHDATVKVFHAGTRVKTVTAPPGVATIISLDPLNLNESSITDKVYLIESDIPIVAYQFNPLENVDVFSNDASLLLPTGVVGRNYRIMSMPNGGTNASTQNLTSNFAIVAVEEGLTTIRVTPTVGIAAGSGGLAGTSCPAEVTWSLQKGQVANVKALPDKGLDFTGSLIEADKRIAVFSGHVCSTAPVSRCVGLKCSFDPTIACSKDADCPIVMACDHLEEQIQQIEAWGKEYVIPKTAARGKAPDLIRVMGSVASTKIMMFPPIKEIPTIGAGEFAEFEIDKSVVLMSDKPFFAAIILEGEDAPGSAHDQCANAAATDFCENDPSAMCVCITGGGSCQTNADCSPDDANVGDPSLITAVPVQQLRKDYVFLAPTKYKDNYISITASKNAVVTLDGVRIAASDFTAVSGSEYVTAVMPVESGSHSLSSDTPVGLYVYGWDRYVSYGYPGGMMLNE